MEAAGIAPASREASVRASTCVADRLIVGLGAPTGRVPFGLSCHEFNPCRNKRLGTGDPELASPAEALGRSPGARPLLFLRQRDGDQHCCWQLSFGRLFTRPADQPRHATVHFGHPVDPGSPPNRRSCERDSFITRDEQRQSELTSHLAACLAAASDFRSSPSEAKIHRSRDIH